MKKTILLILIFAAVNLILTACETATPDKQLYASVASVVTPAEIPVTTPEPVKVCSAKIVSVIIPAEDNGITADIYAEIDNECITVKNTLANFLPSEKLNNLRIVVNTDGGTYSFNSANINTDGSVIFDNALTLTLTDKDGVEAVYSFSLTAPESKLPVVSITTTDNAPVYRKLYTGCTFSIDSSLTENYASIETVEASIRGRGHSTWYWEKKPYKIKLNEKISVLGLPKSDEWILLSNYADKTFLRNITAYEMSKQFGSFIFNETQIPVDLYLNGEYKGVYTLGQHLEVAKNKIEIDRTEGEIDTGYLLEITAVDDEVDVLGEDFFHTDSGCAKFISIINPDTDYISAEQFDFISGYVQKADDAIVALDGYEEYIDIDTFVDWFLMTELSYNLDTAFRRSCYITKDKGGKLKMGPMWDFDLAFGNFIMDNGYYNNWCTCGYDNEDAYIGVTWYNYLLQDPNFRTKARERWDSIKDNLLETAHKTIQSNYELIYPSQKENFKVWDILTKVAGFQREDNVKYYTYDLQIIYLENFIKTRAAWIDRNL